jgi:hypothetical protein
MFCSFPTDWKELTFRKNYSTKEKALILIKFIWNYVVVKPDFYAMHLWNYVVVESDFYAMHLWNYVVVKSDFYAMHLWAWNAFIWQSESFEVEQSDSTIDSYFKSLIDWFAKAFSNLSVWNEISFIKNEQL